MADTEAQELAVSYLSANGRTKADVLLKEVSSMMRPNKVEVHEFYDQMTELEDRYVVAHADSQTPSTHGNLVRWYWLVGGETTRRVKHAELPSTERKETPVHALALA